MSKKMRTIVLAAMVSLTVLQFAPSGGGGGSLTFLRRSQSASAASNATSAAAAPPPPPALVSASSDKSTLHKIGLFLGLQTESPTSYPTAMPTTATPTTATPTDTPSMTPTNSPTEVPTEVPTATPTGNPTDAPIIDPLDQLLSKYDIPVSALDCDGGKDVVSSYPPPGLYPNGSAVLCVIVLNEKPYIDEWINYHLGLGFSKIVVYDNSASFDLREWRLQEQITPMVEVIHFPGLAPQERSYLTCAQSALNGQFGENKKWAAFFDVDEFLVLKKHEHVDQLLEEHLPKGSGALGINWAWFTFNGKLLCDAKPVTKRFVYRDPNVNQHVKSIVRLEDMKMNSKPHAHYPHLKNGNQHDTNGTVFSGPFNKNGPLDVAAFHHYNTKSYGEFVKKGQRGRTADGMSKMVNGNVAVAAAAVDRMKVFNEAIKLFEDALEKNSSGKLGLAETDVVFDDSAWTLLKKVSPGYAVFDELN